MKIKWNKHNYWFMCYSHYDEKTDKRYVISKINNTYKVGISNDDNVVWQPSINNPNNKFLGSANTLKRAKEIVETLLRGEK